jgi:Flp pilus assembly CpaF family ATPase
MFLIINGREIFRTEMNPIHVGFSTQGELTVADPAIGDPVCTITRDSADRLLLIRQESVPIRVNDTEVEIAQPRQIEIADELAIGDATIHLREVGARGAVAKVFDRKRFALQAELHTAVLDRLRVSTIQHSDQDYRKQIEAEMGKILAEITITPEIEDFLSTQALLELMKDRAHGYGRVSRKATREAIYQQFSSLIQKLEATIQIEADETPEQRTERIEALVPWFIRFRRGLVNPDDKRGLAIGLLREQLIDLIFGLGPLEDLMADPGISEVMVLPSGGIFVERKGRIENSGRRMPSQEVSRRVIERIVTREGRRVDQTSPIVDVRLSDGSRGNFIVEPVSLKGPVITIRRFSAKRLTMDDLIRSESLSPAVAAFLRAAVVARKNILISGGTGSGKTTLLNALAAFVPADERILTAEDTAEIQLWQEHVVALQAKNANLEGKGAIPIRELVKAALRQRPDRIIVGECRGGETLDMLQAMNTGHDGSLTTIHANRPADAMQRLIVTANQAEDVSLPDRTIKQQIATALDIVVQIERMGDGSRRVTSVCEVVEMDEEDGTIIVEEIFHQKNYRKRARQKIFDLHFTGYVPTFTAELLQKGGGALEEMFG